MAIRPSRRCRTPRRWAATGTANGTANVNLQGTPFAVDDTFVTDDPGIGGATFSQLDQVVDLTGGGGCGWTQAAGGDFNPFNPDALPTNFSLDLRYVNATPVTVSTPVLFASIARTGSTADLYALVDGAESISVTVEVRTRRIVHGRRFEQPDPGGDDVEARPMRTAMSFSMACPASPRASS